MKFKRALVLLLFIIGCARQGAITSFERKPLPSFDLPTVDEVRLDNGLTCFLLEDHSLPIVNVQVITRAGSIFEDPHQAGLAELTGRLMRTGGTGSFTATAFDQEIDTYGFQLSHDVGREASVAHLKALSSELEKALSLMMEMLFAPRFDVQRLAIARDKLLEDLRRENDEPARVADRTFTMLVYGEQSPWASRPTPQSLKSLRAADLRQFHSRYFVPQNMILAVAGDFQRDDVQRLLIQMLRGVQNDPVQFTSLAPVRHAFAAEEQLIRRPLTQSYIRMGHLGIKRDNPDKFAITVMNHILGASDFKSRLMEDIRTKRGLAYGISSNFSAGLDYGLFEVQVATKAASTALVVKLIRDHLEAMARGEGVAEEEVAFARRTILSRQIFLFDQPFEIVSRRALYRFMGYPDDYWLISQRKIQEVDVADVKRVAQQYLHPAALKLVIVGPNNNGNH